LERQGLSGNELILVADYDFSLFSRERRHLACHGAKRRRNCRLSTVLDRAGNLAGKMPALPTKSLLCINFLVLIH
jgi:hypothetical protein